MAGIRYLSTIIEGSVPSFNASSIYFRIFSLSPFTTASYTFSTGLAVSFFQQPGACHSLKPQNAQYIFTVPILDLQYIRSHLYAHKSIADGFNMAMVSPYPIAIARKAEFIQALSGIPKDTFESPTIVRSQNFGYTIL